MHEDHKILEITDEDALKKENVTIENTSTSTSAYGISNSGTSKINISNGTIIAYYQQGFIWKGIKLINPKTLFNLNSKLYVNCGKHILDIVDIYMTMNHSVPLLMAEKAALGHYWFNCAEFFKTF